jgi:membrane protein DedA with SNARE-associated domain
MTVIAVICALATATWIGYYLGRRAGSTPSSWKKRTSRIALGRLAIGLLVLVTARRVRQRFQAGRMLPIAVLRAVGPVEFLRAGVARMRPY